MQFWLGAQAPLVAHGATRGLVWCERFDPLGMGDVTALRTVTSPMPGATATSLQALPERYNRITSLRPSSLSISRIYGQIIKVQWLVAG